MKILGLNAYHGDSAACLFVDGKLIAAAEEERFRRIKHWAGLPTSAINYVLEEAKLRLEEVDHIAINRKPGVNNLRRLGFVLTHWPHPKLIAQKIKNIRSAASVKETLQANFSYPGSTKPPAFRSTASAISPAPRSESGRGVRLRSTIAFIFRTR